MSDALTSIPNVGPAVARKLGRLGITRPDELRNGDADALFARLCALDGRRHDPCLLDTFVAAVAYANGCPPDRGGSSAASARRGPVADLELRLGWVIVYVEDPAAAAAFYEGAFGLRGEFTAPDGSYAQLDTGATKLAFASYALGETNFDGGVRRAPRHGPPANVEITLVADDVDPAYARALEDGCTPLAAPRDKPHGQRVAYVRDPFGTLVELATPL